MDTTTMRRAIAIAASSIIIGGCAEMSLSKFELPSMSMPSFTPPAATTTLEFESEPAGAEVRTSTGQACRTPCSLAVAASELSATFTLPGYQQQSVPVRMAAASEGVDPMTGQVTAPRLAPNPVYVELVAAAPPPRRAAPAPTTKPAAKKKPKATAAPAKPPAEPMAAPPGAAPASPWPAPQTR